MFELFKQKVIKINNKQALVITLTRIYELLRDNGFSPQAEAVKKPLQYLHLDDTNNFLKTLKTVDIWGGSGSAWEVYGLQHVNKRENLKVHLFS